MDKEEMRKAFEEWARRMGFPCDYEGPSDDPVYVSNDTWALWGCWQAAMAHSCEANARDAARYRWLRQRFVAADFDYGGSDEVNGVPALVFEVDESIQVSASLDLTVDTALSRHGG